jgi:hypothetical protein
MANDNGKILRIADLRAAIAGRMEDTASAPHDVLQMDFETHHDLKSAEGSADAIDVLRAAVRKVVPTLSDDEIAKYNMKQAEAILMLSGAGIAAVERLFPNAVRPESLISPA